MIVDVQTVAGMRREHNAQSSGLQDAVRFRTQTSRRAMAEDTPESPGGEERRWLLKLCAVGGGRGEKGKALSTWPLEGHTFLLSARINLAILRHLATPPRSNFRA